MKGQEGACSAESFGKTMLIGGIGGAVGGAIGGSLGGRLAQSALGKVLPRLATDALEGAAVGGLSGGATGGIDYGLTCHERSGGCSWSGAAGAATKGAAVGAIGGAADGAIGGRAARRHHRQRHQDPPPHRHPPSTSTCLIQVRDASPCTPSWSATWAIVPVLSPVCSRSSQSIRTARSRSSAEYFLGGAIAPHPSSSQGSGIWIGRRGLGRSGRWHRRWNPRRIRSGRRGSWSRPSCRPRWSGTLRSASRWPSM